MAAASVCFELTQADSAFHRWPGGQLRGGESALVHQVGDKGVLHIVAGSR